jgi:hypothetical protein
VRIEVDPGDGAADCGVIAEGDWSVHDDALILKIAGTPATAHPLMGRDPLSVAKKALRERLKETVFNRPLRYSTIGIV